MGSIVTDVDGDGLEVRDRAGATVRHPAGTVLWAAGVEAPPVAEALAAATGARRDRAGRIEVQPDLTVAGHPEISVVGDLMSLRACPVSPRWPCSPGSTPDAGSGTGSATDVAVPVPLLRPRLGGLPVPRQRGRCSAGPLRFAGFGGWLTWLFIHLAFLTGYPQPVRRRADLGRRLRPRRTAGTDVHDPADRDPARRLRPPRGGQETVRRGRPRDPRSPSRTTMTALDRRSAAPRAGGPRLRRARRRDGVATALLVIAQAGLLSEVIARAFLDGAGLGELALPLVLLLGVVVGRAALAWAGEVAAARRRGAVIGQLRAACSTTCCVWDRAIPACPPPGSWPPWPSAGWTGSTATSAATCPRSCVAAVVPLLVGVRILTADWVVGGDRRRDRAPDPPVHGARSACAPATAPPASGAPSPCSATTSSTSSPGSTS